MTTVTNSPQGLKYHVDITFVVDTTGSMSSLIDTVKKNILNFYPDLIRVANEKGKSVSQLRIRVISFKNYEYDKQDAIISSNFFTLSNESQMDSEEDKLKEYVDHLEATGGSLSSEQGWRENGLEALTEAIRSEWDMGGNKRRHIIVLFTDVAPLLFEEGRNYAGSYYPSNMPKNLDELTDMWDAPQGALMPKASKRLCLFAPECETWSTISSTWNEVTHWPAKAGEGLSETDYNQILDAIMNSI